MTLGMDYLVDDCRYRFPGEKITSSIFTKIYYAAKLDLARTMIAALNDISNPELLNYLLNVKFEEEDGQCVTPLVLAAKNGHTTFIRTILSRYNFDLEQECNVIFDGLVVHGATALWVAAGMGHMEIVKVLVHRGANINHNTKALSSPLRAACYEGRLDIVMYLIEHGADVNLANAYNNTCVMIAAYKGHTAIVDTLLKSGADPNEQAFCGATALHYAAECDYVEVCELLLDHGAIIQMNEYGLTPILQAAERSHETVVQMFINRKDLMTKEEKIVALELLGASFANDKDNYSVDKAFRYLSMAMELRYIDSNIIRKRPIVPVPAYDNWIETQTVEDLEAIRLNHHSIHMESLTIRERILGKNYPDLAQPIVYRGAIFADQERFDICCMLWNYAIDLRMKSDLSVERDLLRFSQLFSQMVRLEQNLDLSVAVSVLEKCQKEIENNKRRMEKPGPRDIIPIVANEYDTNIVTALNLTKIITLLIGNKKTAANKPQMQHLYSVISNLVHTEHRLADGQTLLHKAVSGVTPMEDFYTSEICRFPCYKTALLLVHVGASVNAQDCERNTPLHVLISSIRRDNPANISQTEKIVQLFATAGAHLDAVNGQGLTPTQLASVSSIGKMMVKYQNKYTSLKCIAARNVAFYKLKYKGFVPKTLETFMQMHSNEKLDF